MNKLEKNRYSLFTDDLEHCILCGATNPDINEIFMGRNRTNSMKYGMCIPLCRFHHLMYHSNRGMQLYWMKLGREEFLKNHSEEEWFKTFRYIKE
jgi:beta-galactosidase/beta-glucuronidase